MKKLQLVLALCVLSVMHAYSQVTVSGGTGATAGSPYTTLSAAITAINTGGALSAPVVVDVAAGHSETLTGKIVLTMTGTSSNTITIQKSGSGANPYLTAYTGTVATPSNVADGFFVLAGVDYVTIDGIDLLEAAGNTTTTTVMEFGYGLFKASVTDGCQNNTIKNCTITLNRVQNTTWTAPGHNGSVGIAVNNGLYTASGAITPTAASGSNSYNKFYTNTIQNCNAGISIVGYAAPTPFTLGDTGNDIGGTSSGTGNTIQNFGGGAATNPATGIFASNQWGMNCSYNTLNNNTGAGVNHATTMRGIFLNSSSTSASVNCNYNTVTLKSAATTSLLLAIDVEFGSTAAGNTVNVNNNTVQNSTYTTATTGAFQGILLNSSATNVNVNNNTVTGNSIPGTGQFDGIVMQSTPVNAYMNGNTVSNNTKTSTGTMHCMYFSGSPTNFTSNSNTVSGNSMTGASGTLYGIRFSTSIINSNGNTVSNLSIPSTSGATASSIYGIYSLSSPTVENFTNSQISGLSIGGTSTSTTHIINGIRTNSVSGSSKNLSGNTITNLSFTGSAGSCSMRGIVTTTGNGVAVNLNRIGNLLANGASSTASGIEITSGTTVTATNNIIGDLRVPNANASNPLIGISITGGTTMNVYHNTVYLNGTSSGALFGSSAISASSTPTVNLINNIFVNTSATTGAGLAAAYRRSSTTLTTYGSSSDRNLLYGSTIFTDGTNTDATFAAYKTRVATRDANSVTENPTWVSTTASDATFLHINTSVATAIESGGTFLASVTTDYDGDTRNTSTPDIGADEGAFTVLSGCSGTPTAGSISGANAVCTGLGTTLTLTGASTDLGITYQWASSTTSGGPYTNILGTAATQATGALTTTTYYQVTVTCANGGATATTLEKEVLVNSLPTVTLTPSASIICQPGGSAVALTAGGASTYTYNPTTGLTPTSGANVSSLPSSNTTYTVTGTDANGCINTATAQVSIGAYPSVTSVTATPSTFCSGAQSTLEAIATIPSAPTTYTFAGSTGTYSAITGTSVSAAIGDDFGIGNLPIGFTFSYNGVAQTVFGVSSNGMILLGNTAAAWTTGYSSNSLSGTANIISPFWDDNNTTGGSVQYLTAGTAPNRTLTVQWTGMHVGGSGSATNPTIDIQAVLNENGTIQFNYGPTSAALSSPTASVGITGAVGVYVSVTPANPASSSTTSSSTSNNSVTEANLPNGTVYTFTPPMATYSWANAGDVVSPTTATTLTNTLTSTTTYTVTISNGACSTTSSVTAALAGAIVCSPITSSNGTTICVGQNTTLTASATIGGTPYTYAWTADASLSATNIANPVATPTTTTTYTCTITDACGTTCSTTLTINVNPTPTATASSNGPVCTGTTLNLTGTTDFGTSFSWTGPNSFTSTTQNPTLSSVTVLEAGTYSFTATDNGCTSAPSTVTVVVNPTPSAVTITPASSSITCGSSQTLDATGGEILVSSILGTGTSSSTATSTGSALGPNPFQSYYGGAKQQMLILASELTSMGLVSGSTINSIAFNLSAVEARTLLDYTVKMKLTSQTSFASTTFATGMTTVKTPASYTPATGWNTIPLTSNFAWDGSNNLIIEVNFSNNDGGGSGTSTARLSTTGFASSLFYRTDNATAATVDAQATASFAAYSSRNNITLGYSLPSSFAWTPSASLNTATGTNVIASPVATTTYTVTATANGCSASNTVTVTVNPNPDIALATAANAASIVGSSCLTQTLANNDMIIYLNSSCSRILNIADEPAGSGLGSTSACVNVSATNPVGTNGQVYAPRYFEIIPTVSEGAAMVAYFTQADFDAYNAANGSLLDFPANGSDPNSANVLVAQVAGGTLATGTISSITPVFVSWNATDLRWQVVFNATSLGGYYYLFSNPSCNYTMPAATVSNITATSAQFDWSTAGAGLTYDWRYRVQGSPTWTNAGTGTSAITRVFTGLASNTTYEFQGKVRCGAGLSGLFGTTVTFTTAMGPCTAPSGLAVSQITASSAKFDWSAMSSPVTSYIVRYRTPVGSGIWMNAGGTANTRTITNLLPSTNYEVQVSSYCLATNTQTAFTNSVLFTTTTPCPVPTNLAATAVTGNSVLFTWDAMAAPATSYILSYRVVGSGTWLNAGVSTNSRAIYGLTAGTNYEGIVKSYCSSTGTLTSASNTATFTTSAGCPVTSGVSSNGVTTTQATITWSDVSTATSGNKYILRYRLSPSGAWNNAGCPVASRSLAGLVANTSYDIEVSTVCLGGTTSAFSSTYTFTTAAAKPGETEPIVELTTASTSFNIYPNPTSDIIHVELQANEAQTTTVKVYDLTGRLMKQVVSKTEAGAQKIEVSLGEIASGMYTIQVYENDKLTHISRVRKN